MRFRNPKALEYSEPRTECSKGATLDLSICKSRSSHWSRRLEHNNIKPSVQGAGQSGLEVYCVLKFFNQNGDVHSGDKALGYPH